MTTKITKAEQEIKFAMLENGWEKGEAEAARVYKKGRVWQIEPFNSPAFAVGKTAKEAIEKLELDWQLKQEGAI